MKTEHTPGPWRVGTMMRPGRTSWPDGIFTGPNDHDAICVARICGLPINHALEELQGEPRYSESLANASLIALAPELVEALRGYVLAMTGANHTLLEHADKVSRALLARLEEK